MLVFVQLLLDGEGRFWHRRVLSRGHGWISEASLGWWGYLSELLKARRDDVEQLGCEHVVPHKCQLTQDLNFSQNFSCWVLVIESIANLFNGDFFFRNSMFGPNHSAKTTLPTNLNQLEFLLDQFPLIRQLYHLATFVPQEPALDLELGGWLKVSPRCHGVRRRCIRVVHISI